MVSYRLIRGSPGGQVSLEDGKRGGAGAEQIAVEILQRKLCSEGIFRFFFQLQDFHGAQIIFEVIGGILPDGLIDLGECSGIGDAVAVPELRSFPKGSSLRSGYPRPSGRRDPAGRRSWRLRGRPYPDRDRRSGRTGARHRWPSLRQSRRSRRGCGPGDCGGVCSESV